jgi:hypothetical protein
MVSKNYQYFFILAAGLAGFFLQGCGVEDFNEPDYISPVHGLAAYPHDGFLTITFTSVNDEQRFDGFNVYLSTSSEVANQTLAPLSPDGALPTVPAVAVAPGSSRTVSWDVRRDADNAPLVNGTTYYLVVRGHSVKEYLSDPCNEAATTPRPESVSAVPLSAGNGYSLAAGGTGLPWDFDLVLTNSLLSLRPLNGAVLKDEGYYPEPSLYNAVATNGFPAPGLLFQAVAGHVYVLKTGDRKFGRIYLDSVLGSSVQFRWAFQNKTGNLHI